MFLGGGEFSPTPEQTGFSVYFTRRFKQYYLVSPLAYRGKETPAALR